MVNAVYEIENVRHLDRTDFNLLRLTIETDGSKSPEEALEEAVKILIAQLEAIIYEEKNFIVNEINVKLCLRYCCII